MGKTDVLELIKKFYSSLKAHGVAEAKIILYGSWANGNAHEDSDIDLVVISDDFKGKDYWARVNILSEAVYQVFAPIEAVALTLDEWKNRASSVCDYAKNGEVVAV